VEVYKNVLIKHLPIAF